MDGRFSRPALWALRWASAARCQLWSLTRRRWWYRSSIVSKAQKPQPRGKADVRYSGSMMALIVEGFSPFAVRDCSHSASFEVNGLDVSFCEGEKMAMVARVWTSFVLVRKCHKSFDQFLRRLGGEGAIYQGLLRPKSPRQERLVR
jgi:hypothetical protein